LTPEERNQIPDFIASPIFYKGTNRERLTKLYQILRGEIQKREADIAANILTEQDIYAILYPNMVWNQNTFDPLESLLLKITLRAIAFWNSGLADDMSAETLPTKQAKTVVEDNRKMTHLTALLHFYNDRNMSAQFDKTLKELQNLGVKQPNCPKNLHRLYIAERLAFDKISTFQAKDADVQLAKTRAQLDAFYVSATFDLLNQNLHNLAEELPKLATALPQLAGGQMPQSVLFDLFQLLDIAQKTKNKQAFDDFLALLATVEKDLTDELRKDLYTHARNFCSRCYREGDRIFLKRHFDLHKKNLADGLLYRPNGKNGMGLLQGTFVSIFNIALKSNELAWALAFLQKNQQNVITETKEDRKWFYNFNLAHYHFACENYKEAIKILEVEFPILSYHLAARCLEIKLYFKKPNKHEREYDFLDKRLNAFVKQMSDKKMSMEDKKPFLNFIKYIRLLTSYQQPYTKKKMDKQALKAAICNEKKIQEREWLLEQLV
jgi:hypothetical protein